MHDKNGITRLEATGLPLGLFSHVPQGSSTCALLPGAALLVVSRGIVEAECAGTEFGLEGTVRCIQGTRGFGAHELCTRVLQAAEEFAGVPLTHNDVTALALVRVDSVD